MMQSSPEAPRRRFACPVCKSQSLLVFLKGREPELSAEAIGQSRTQHSPGTVLRCAKCGLAFRGECPDSGHLATLYTEQEVDVYLAEASGRRATARRQLRLVQELARPGRILDVGCGAGFFLEEAQRAGWEIVGVEPSSKLCDEARRMLRGRGEIRCARLETSELEPTCFDVITLWDVLEHVPDPVAFLSSCNSHLKEGGTLLLNVPHIDSAVAKVFGSRWPLLLPEHLSYFSRRSVEVCAMEAGLEVIRLRQRPAYFSLSHVLHRMGEHRIPAARKIRDLVRWVGLGDLVTPIYLGELLAILRKPT